MYEFDEHIRHKTEKCNSIHSSLPSKIMNATGAYFEILKKKFFSGQYNRFVNYFEVECGVHFILMHTF